MTARKLFFKAIKAERKAQTNLLGYTVENDNINRDGNRDILIEQVESIMNKIKCVQGDNHRARYLVKAATVLLAEFECLLNSDLD